MEAASTIKRKGYNFMVGKERFREINALLNQALAEKKSLVAVHRGAWGGNIIENTIPAYVIARNMGADMFECDLSSYTDGVVYAFHDGGERRMFGETDNIKTMPSQRIEALTYKNSLGEESKRHVEHFENILAYFTHGELFNIDRAWDILPQVDEIMRRYPHAIRQAVIKTPVKDEHLEFFNSCPEKYMYMPIVYNMDEVRKVLSYPDINLVGMELIAVNPEDELFQQENVEWIQQQGLYVWVNVITLSSLDKHRLYGGLDDDTALLDNPDKSWGVLLQRGIDILQTDWPMQLSRYRDAYFGL